MKEGVIMPKVRISNQEKINKKLNEIETENTKIKTSKLRIEAAQKELEKLESALFKDFDRKIHKLMLDNGLTEPYQFDDVLEIFQQILNKQSSEKADEQI